MSGSNLLILTVYLIVVAYVLYKANKSLESKITLELDTANLNNQLEANNLNGLVDINFKKNRPSYQYDELKTIMVTIQNKFDEATQAIIRVNWDESSIIDYENALVRTIRVSKGMAEIPQKQVPTVITPGQKIDQEISDDKDIGAPLFPKTLKFRAAVLKGIPFYVRLSLKIAQPGKDERSCFISCKLSPRKLRWTRALAIELTPKPPKKK